MQRGLRIELSKNDCHVTQCKKWCISNWRQKTIETVGGLKSIFAKNFEDDM